MPHDRSDVQTIRHRARDSRSRSRSRSPYRSSTHRTSHRRQASPPTQERRRETEREVQLPFGARKLSKHDYKVLKSLFGLYLDVQKQLDLDELEEREARGRWRSFVNKWNHGELAEGWYDPETFTRAERSLQESEDLPAARRAPPRSPSPSSATPAYDRPAPQHDDGSDDDDYGPALPTTLVQSSHKVAAGATIPTTQDLALRREADLEDRSSALNAHRQERTAHRKLEKARLDELAPKAEPGTRERQVEKKREAAASNRAFAASKTEGDGQTEVRDEDLMGGGDSVEELKRIKRDNERKRSEREIRREEVLRAQRAERDERMKAYREKEAQTMKGLVELARQRFG